MPYHEVRQPVVLKAVITTPRCTGAHVKDAGVVDQACQGLCACIPGFGEGADGVQRSQVQLLHLHAGLCNTRGHSCSC